MGQFYFGDSVAKWISFKSALTARLLSIVDLDEDGIWLGTTHGVIRYFDGSFEEIISKGEVGSVKSLSVSDGGDLWLVASDGVLRYSMTEKAPAVTILNHLENGRVLCAYVQDEAITYITTNGVFRKYKGHTLKQSVLTTQLTSQSVRYFCEMSTQAVYFAGDLGVFYLSTNTLDKLFNLPLRPSFVSTVYIDDLPYSLGPLSQTPLFSVLAKSTARIDISQMPFNLREGVTYKLEGGGKDTWHKTKDNQLIFSALDSGDYTLVLKESTGGEETQRQVFSFTVVRVWYEKLGVMIVSILAMAWLCFFYFHKKSAKRVSKINLFSPDITEKVHLAEETDSADLVSVIKPHFPEMALEPTIELREIASQHDQKALVANDELWKNNVQGEIDKHYGDPEYSTSSLAGALFISERSLQRRFKAVFGYTFKEALISARLENAKHLLAKGEKVSDVSIACGFNEPSYFSKSFKARFDCMPTQYRERFEEKSV